MARYGFITNTAGTTIPLEYSDAVSRAYDILANDGMSPEKSAQLALGAEQSGRDPIAFANHVVKIRKGLRC